MIRHRTQVTHCSKFVLDQNHHHDSKAHCGFRRSPVFLLHVAGLCCGYPLVVVHKLRRPERYASRLPWRRRSCSRHRQTVELFVLSRRLCGAVCAWYSVPIDALCVDGTEGMRLHSLLDVIRLIRSHVPEPAPASSLHH